MRRRPLPRALTAGGRFTRIRSAAPTARTTSRPRMRRRASVVRGGLPTVLVDRAPVDPLECIGSVRRQTRCHAHSRTARPAAAQRSSERFLHLFRAP
jgi:hypothetical protein